MLANETRMLTDDLVRDAEKLEQQGMLSDAVALLEAALDQERAALVLAHLGRLYRLTGRLDEARGLLTEAVEQDGNLSAARFYLGFYHLRHGDLDIAREQLERGLEIEEWSAALVALGSAYRQLHRVGDAIRAYERATVLAPDSDEAWAGLGIAYKFLDAKKSIECLEKAVALDPENPAAQRELGHMLWREGDDAAAEEKIRRALTIAPQDAWAHEYLGSLLILRGDVASAEQEYRQAAEIMPDVPLFQSDLGYSLAVLGRTREAEERYLRALALDVSHAKANLDYGELLEGRGEIEKAKMYLRRAFKKWPTNRRLLAALKRIGIEPGEM